MESLPAPLLAWAEAAEAAEAQPEGAANPQPFAYYRAVGRREATRRASDYLLVWYGQFAPAPMWVDDWEEVAVGFSLYLRLAADNWLALMGTDKPAMACRVVETDTGAIVRPIEARPPRWSHAYRAWTFELRAPSYR